MSSGVSSTRDSQRILGPVSAGFIVVATMIGSGIFTTSGYLLETLQSPVTLLAAWLFGGVLALFGALTYAELAVAIPRSGGEYHYLSKLIHPSIGFMSGWISLLAGFSAPIAATGIAFGYYLSAVFPIVHPVAAGIGLILLFSILHLYHIQIGVFTQNLFTMLKLAIILIFLAALFFTDNVKPVYWDFSSGFQNIWRPTFAVSLIFVSYAYSGWNAATYLGGEIKNPRINIPKALILGTLLVVFLYMGLNILYLLVLTPQEMIGTLEVGHLASLQLFGPIMGKLFSLFIALILISTTGAMIMTGPRVYEAVGADYPLFAHLAKRSSGGTPALAIMLQGGIAIIFILTSAFDALLYYAGFTLSLFAGLAVASVYVLRRKKAEYANYEYHTLGYPFTPAIFVLLSGWMVFHTLFERPLESLIGLLTLLIGFVLYWVSRPRNKE